MSCSVTVITAAQQFYDVTNRFEAIQNELSIVRLENNEYQKEVKCVLYLWFCLQMSIVIQIKTLRQQNEELMKENHSYLESLELRSREISYLLTNAEKINVINNDLEIQISQYKQEMNNLRSQNKTLQLENEQKYQSDWNYIQSLQNQLESLQSENLKLRQEINNEYTLISILLSNHMDLVNINIPDLVNIIDEAVCHATNTNIANKRLETHKYRQLKCCCRRW